MSRLTRTLWLLPALIGAAALGLRANRLGAAWWNNQGARHLNAAQITPGLTDTDRYAATVDAGRALEQALRFDPSYGKAYTNLGGVYMAFGDLPAAAQTLAEAARFTPRDWRARFYQGQALAAQGREAEARVAWQAAGAAPYFLDQAESLRGADPEGARLAAERAIAIAPQSIDGYLSLGQTLSAQKAYTDALATYQTAIARCPDASNVDLAGAYYQTGVLLYRYLDRTPEAGVALEQALALQPENESTRLELAAVAEKRGACYEAESWLEPLLRSPSSPAQGARADVLIGRCLLAQERAQAAVAYLERAVAGEPTSVSYRLLLAQAYRATDRIDAAIDTYTHVLTLDPDQATALKALDELEAAP